MQPRPGSPTPSSAATGGTTAGPMPVTTSAPGRPATCSNARARPISRHRSSRYGSPPSRSQASIRPHRTAGVCAFSVTSRVTQRDGGTGHGHAGKPHLAAPRRPGTHWRAPPRHSGGLTACRSPGPLDDSRRAPFACPGSPVSPGTRPAAGHPGTVLELLQHQGVPAGPPAHPCAVTHDQPYVAG